MQITELVPGDRVRLLDFGQTKPCYRRRLLSFGITRGTILSVLRVAPLGCPIQMDVRGTSISLRKDEAGFLLLEQV